MIEQQVNIHNQIAQTLARIGRDSDRLARLEALTHPDLVDAYGRRWTWWKGDLWRHGSKAWGRCMLPEPVAETPLDHEAIEALLDEIEEGLGDVN